MEFCRSISLCNRLALAFCFLGMDMRFHKKFIIHLYKEKLIMENNQLVYETRVSLNEAVKNAVGGIVAFITAVLI